MFLLLYTEERYKRRVDDMKDFLYCLSIYMGPRGKTTRWNRVSRIWNSLHSSKVNWSIVLNSINWHFPLFYNLFTFCVSNWPHSWSNSPPEWNYNSIHIDSNIILVCPSIYLVVCPSQREFIYIDSYSIYRSWVIDILSHHLFK